MVDYDGFKLNEENVYLAGEVAAVFVIGKQRRNHCRKLWHACGRLMVTSVFKKKGMW